MKKQVILHCIDSLHVGGAEVLLKNSIQSLSRFSHVVVYLHPPDTLKHEFTGDVEFLCLGFFQWKDIRKAVRRLRKIIRHYKPLLVHSHLFYSTLVSRFATGTNTPLVSTLHSIFSIDAFNKNRLSVWAEKLTLKRRHILVSVSRFVLTDYLNVVHHKGRSFVLYNFIPPSGFRKKIKTSASTTLKCLAVGGLKEAKNYPYLLQIFEELKDEPIELDIFGEGQLRKELQKMIDDHQLKVSLRGQNSHIQDLLPEYDLFIQASTHEGFGLSVIEAMAQGLPIFISDIPALHEITGERAHFFPLNDPRSAAVKLKKLLADPQLLQKYVDEGFALASEAYSQEKYIQSLLAIYSEATQINLAGQEEEVSATCMTVNPIVKP